MGLQKARSTKMKNEPIPTQIFVFVPLKELYCSVYFSTIWFSLCQQMKHIAVTSKLSLTQSHNQLVGKVKIFFFFTQTERFPYKNSSQPKSTNNQPIKFLCHLQNSAHQIMDRLIYHVLCLQWLVRPIRVRPSAAEPCCVKVMFFFVESRIFPRF